MLMMSMRSHAFSPWGTLEARPLLIAPPAEYVPRNDGPAQPARWHFPGATRERLARDLGAAGLNADDVAYLMNAAKVDDLVSGLCIEPGSAFVRRLSAPVRSHLYAELAKSPANFDQASAYYFHGDSIDAWLGKDVPPNVRAIVDPLTYRIGEFLYLADIEIVREAIGNGPDFQNLVRRLLRASAMFISLSIAEPDDLDDVTEYWGRGGRKTDIRPLLESIADAGPSQTLDLSELLPELPRRLLYRYPKVTMADLAKPQLENCFWTALNFFSDEPDDRFLDVTFAMNALRNDYFLVHDHLQLGDIAVFSGRDMNVFHVAVYLAQDLVFTKNGAFSLAPWTILPIDQLKGPYVGHADDWVVTYYRRKDL
jgi:hypothetical protein